MGEVYTKRPGDFLLDLITSDMNLARAFVAVARSAYRLGKGGDGDFARLKAIHLYSEAARLVSQLNESLQETWRPELQAVGAAISGLFIPAPAPEERLCVERPLITRSQSEGLARGD